MPVLSLIPFLHLMGYKVVLQCQLFLLLTDTHSDPTWAGASFCSHGSRGVLAYEQHSWLWLVIVSWNLICYFLGKLKGQAFFKKNHVTRIEFQNSNENSRNQIAALSYSPVSCHRIAYDEPWYPFFFGPINKAWCTEYLSICLCLVIVCYLTGKT